MKVLLIDNYDSFTFNLKALIEMAGAEVLVVRNDKIQTNQIEEADGIVLSPGPGIPENAGQMMDIIQTYHLSKPILGVCLGMQAIGQIFGAELELLEKPIHGFSSEIKHNGDRIFKDIPQTFEAARYHSWVIKKASVYHPLEVIASSSDSLVMAIKHVDLPIYGFQFHPESILTNSGIELITNFLIQLKENCNATTIK